MVAAWTTLLSSTEPWRSYDFVQTQKSYKHDYAIAGRSEGAKLRCFGTSAGSRGIK